MKILKVNLTMDQLINVILTIDKVHTTPQRALDCRPGLCGLNQVMNPTVSLPLLRVYVEYINIFTRCSIMNQFDILLTAVANVSKGQTDMSYQGEHQLLTKQSMRHHVCNSDTFLQSYLYLLFMSRDRSNCGITDYVRFYKTCYGKNLYNLSLFIEYIH